MKQISLTQNKIAIVDNEDYEWLNNWKWHYRPDGYAGTYIHTTKGSRVLLMHRLIMDAPKGRGIDHINHDKLDNRRVNLRFCNQSQNMANRVESVNSLSGYKGVIWDNHANKWRVTIGYNYNRIYLGLYEDVELAKTIYRSVARRLFGEFAG